MKRFCIYYDNFEGERAEYWLYAPTTYAAKMMFKQAAKMNELDYPCADFSSLKIIEQD